MPPRMRRVRGLEVLHCLTLPPGAKSSSRAFQHGSPGFCLALGPRLSVQLRGWPSGSQEWRRGWPVFLLSWPQPPLIDVSLSRHSWGQRHHGKACVCGARGGLWHLNLQMFQMGEPGTSWLPLSLPSKRTFWKRLDLGLASARPCCVDPGRSLSFLDSGLPAARLEESLYRVDAESAPSGDSILATPRA